MSSTDRQNRLLLAEDWKKIYTDYKAFRKDQNAWFRLTEGTFDRYMQQAKL